MLLKERPSGVAGFSAILDKDKSKYGNIIKSKIPLKEKSYYLIVSKKLFQKNPTLAKKIWSEIKKVRSGQEYLNIELKYREKK